MCIHYSGDFFSASRRLPKSPPNIDGNTGKVLRAARPQGKYPAVATAIDATINTAVGRQWVAAYIYIYIRQGVTYLVARFREEAFGRFIRHGLKRKLLHPKYTYKKQKIRGSISLLHSSIHIHWRLPRKGARCFRGGGGGLNETSLARKIYAKGKGKYQKKVKISKIPSGLF